MIEAILAGNGTLARELAVHHVDHFEQSVRETSSLTARRPARRQPRPLRR